MFPTPPRPALTSGKKGHLIPVVIETGLDKEKEVRCDCEVLSASPVLFTSSLKSNFLREGT